MPTPTGDGTGRKSLDERVEVRGMRRGTGNGSGGLPADLGTARTPQYSASDLFDNSDEPDTVNVCWQCEMYWTDDGFEYCPLCSADLVEVEAA